MDLQPAQMVADSLHWPYLITIKRLGLALALGLVVGLEREWRRKEAGFRTYTFVSLIGCVGAMIGNTFALAALAFTALLVTALSVQTIMVAKRVKLATSASLFLTTLTGVLCGQGHLLTPTALAVTSTALLAWKRPIRLFSVGLTEAEFRSAITLAILGLVVYPALPEGSIDPWHLVEPRSAWLTIILIAGVGFINYVLLKKFGKRGVILTGFLGGLVNSTVTVVEMSRLLGRGPTLQRQAYQGIMLATAAMLLRNAVILAMLATATLPTALPALISMGLICGLTTWLQSRKALEDGIDKMPSAHSALPSVRASGSQSAGLQTIETGKEGSTEPATEEASRPPPTPTTMANALPLESPFSLSSTLKFGLVFLILQTAGILTQRVAGPLGFYVVSLAGGLVSSASAVASASALFHQGEIPAHVAAVGAVLASLMSILVNLPLVQERAKGSNLMRQLLWSLAPAFAVGLISLYLAFQFAA